MGAVSIRQSLLRNLMMIILVLAGGIAAITEYGSRQMVARLSRAVITQNLDFTEARLREFFEPVPAALHMARGWSMLGLLDDLDRAGLNKLFRPLMEQYPQVASIRVVNFDGREYLLSKDQGKWSNRETRMVSGHIQARWSDHDAGVDETTTWKATDYDPRQRSWYQSAVAAESHLTEPRGNGSRRAHWTEPYRLPGGRSGITASVSASQTYGISRVFAFDIQLDSVAQFTAALSVSDRGGVMVLTSDGRIIGAPNTALRSAGISPQEVLLRQPADIGWDLATDAAAALREALNEALPARFRSGDEKYWGQARLFPLSNDHHLLFAVVVPEADLLGTLPELRILVLATTLVVILVAILQAFAMSRHYSTPIEALVDESDRISRGDFEQQTPIDTSVTEIRRLADAHERMRSGLQSLMKLERDLKIARQIQQHTFPDHLPTFEGFDLDAFSEPAQHTGGDTYDLVRRPAPDGSGPGESAVLLLADVTGHGIGPALTAVQVRAMLRVAVRMGADLTTIARHLNDQLSADLFGGRFITIWLGELDVMTDTLTYFSAGQAPLIHFRAATGEFDILAADAPPFGVCDPADIHQGTRIALLEGDVFAVFSDGIFESQSAEGEHFGQQRVLRIISENCGDSSGRILLELRKALAEFGGGTPPSDDRTAVVIKRYKSGM